jgi:Sister chromatid cohesion protein Dcc1
VHLATTISSSSSSSSNTSSNHHPAAAPASLVVERKGISFSLQRVETSNALVLVPVPPPPPQQSSLSSSFLENNTHNHTHINKRLKVSNDNDNNNENTNTITISMGDEDGGQEKKKQCQQQNRRLLQVVTARLLNHGSGAWFLEGQAQPLVLWRLQEALQRHHVYNIPAHDDNNNNHHHDHDDDEECNDKDKVATNTTTTATIGRTVESLALEFQCTQHEIHVGLSKLEAAFLWPDGTATSTKSPATTRRYGWLSDEASLVVRDAVLATLLEEDEFGDYAASTTTGGVVMTKLVEHVVRRLQETRPALLKDQATAEFLARHGIGQLQNHEENDTDNNHDLDDNDDDEIIRLSVTKVAVWAARRLFTMQTAPWEQQAFLAKWQSQMPGVGKVYTVRGSMLRGIAVASQHSATSEQNDDDQYCWLYLPRDKLLPINDAAGTAAAASYYMAQLFAAKERWELSELQPYLEYLQDLTGIKSQADILLQYTKIVSASINDDNESGADAGAAGGPKGATGRRYDIYVKR